MMSTPQQKPNTQLGPVYYTIPPGAPQPNTIPTNIQWNVHPVPTQPNVYPASPMWNVSPGPPQMVYPAVQPAVPGYNVANANMPQVTGVSQCHQIFLQGKPKSLGILLIGMAILQISLAISLNFFAFTYTFVSGVQFWGPLFYIIAGSLSIAAQKNSDVCLVKGSLAFNIISSLSSLIGIILNCIDFVYINCIYYDYNYHKCYVSSGAYGIVAVLLIMNLLVFCVSISVSVYGCRALEQVPSNISPVFVIQREFIVSTPPGNSSVPQAPPPYMFQEDENARPAQ